MPNPPSPLSPVSSGKKRPHPSNTPPAQTDPATNSASNLSAPTAVPSTSPAHSIVPASSASSSFRNVSACNRCRLRKNRCDQRLPRCQSCEKAGVRCVGYDPITKREIPRSYVYFLEARVAHLEKQLADNNIEIKKVVAFDEEEAIKLEADGDAAQPRPGSDGQAGEGSAAEKAQWRNTSKENAGRLERRGEGGNRDADDDPANEDNWRLHNLVSNIGMVSVQGTSDPRYLGSTSGISFARVVFAAVRSSLPGNIPDRAIRTSDRLPQSAAGTAGGGGSMRDSFFGLQTRPMMKCATFPDRELAERLVDLYFEHANPQMPILHRGDFMELLDKTYLLEEKKRSPRALYVLNIVFAIGAGIIFEDKPQSSDDESRSSRERPSSGTKRPRLSSHQYQPEEYHASAIIHLESFLGSSSSEGFGGLEELQAVLLLASFALLRPVAPGLWYIVGVAMRLAVDLGLHYEDGAGIDSATKDGNQAQSRIDARERGRREWVRDIRRRLWWCVYSFDRLVATCVGRPFGISDQAISTEFPSMMDDKYITKSGLLTPPDGASTYKHVAFHYFKLRLLQSEIHDVLQYQQARAVRRRGAGAVILPHAELSSPFLQGFDSFRSWRYDVHRRLVEWQDTAPTRPETGVRFSIELLELNYWQAIILLYQQSLTVPAELVGELTPADDVSSPSFSNPDEGEDEDQVYLNVAEAGQKVIRIYRQLHRVRLVNYTYLATHHIFMAGISFLYAIWHSPLVRSRLTLDEVDFTVLAATSVLGDLMHKCPPAEACRDAFERMSKATVQMCLSTTGFGSQVDISRVHATSNSSSSLHPGRPRQHMDQRHRAGQGQIRRATPARPSRPVPKFDMNLADLFTDNTPLTDHTRSENRPAGPSYPPQESVAPNFTADQSSRSYGQRNPSMDYYPKYENPSSPQPHPQFYYANSPQQSASPGSNTHGHALPPAETETPQGMSLDFLDFASGDAEGHGNMEGEANPDYNTMAAPSLGHNLGQNVGIDLGFGMAMDFQHDWSENPNYDLLEGYFFGGSGAGASGGDV
ncbi:transcriptional regulator family: Fungal Specific TF [Penicillium roqueforti]|uniref:Positive regulator of purine utilization n=1 Tax=Penicillium roqueforti (strain FM164) TaxID=1365484 RepID=W6QQM3_PENRF|nr:transcriptional regulator family: Fungal Specific TF [Penicillium roqueforti]CDM38256.1 Positive regulator of purine utilization [Penicillium roqueforti FM164]KAF9249874.1 transcriptional regulator family: Fungal Specific TF [Penicillium roqueforti]KAI1830497.1 transcriptional regulator family: Fungal Specific TF [Penicillium roqueforti]KAI2673713.1 transcriptional regulator family: Fungal Specific TF [Penicillium roqueforti]KAI2684904.1 transcriptional regulator family: Fungal Specific TF 